MLSNRNGVSLVELLVGAAVSSIIVLGAVSLISGQAKNTAQRNAITNTSADMRQFLDARKNDIVKLLAYNASQKIPALPIVLSIPLPFPLPYTPENPPPPDQWVYTKLTVSGSLLGGISAAGSVPYTLSNTFLNTCVPAPTDLGSIDPKISACQPCPPTPSGGLQVPVVSITVSVAGAPPATQVYPANRESTTDGPFAAALCAQLSCPIVGDLNCGKTVVPTQLTLKLMTSLRLSKGPGKSASNSTETLYQEANIPLVLTGSSKVNLMPN